MTDRTGKSRPISFSEYSLRSQQRISQMSRQVSSTNDEESCYEPMDYHEESASESPPNSSEESYGAIQIENDANGLDTSFLCDQDERHSELSDRTDDEQELQDAGSESEENTREWIMNDEAVTDEEEISEDWMDDPLLYEGAGITVGESLLAVLNVFLRHNLTGACLVDILKLVELHCKAPNACKTSLYLFKKYFENIYTALKRHFYCSGCYCPLNGAREECHQCPAGTEQCYFIEISVIKQLETLYRRFDFVHNLQARFNRIKQNEDNYEDIYDGQIYKEWTQPNRFLSNPDNISLMWNTDGVSLFKSSNFQIWPFFFAINELPYEERVKKENLLLGGLWFGSKKPFPALFLNPISDDLDKLKDGIQFEVPSLHRSIIVKGRVICGTCDLPAKALFLNVKQYNSTYGCQKCKIRTERYGQTSIRIYPFQRHLDARTQVETNDFAAIAIDSQETPYGIKGPSAVARFCPNYIRSTAVDEMHAVFLGIVKALLILWFSSKFSQERWSLSKHIRIIDKYLSAIRPPEFVTRLPRSISRHLKYLKASELKAWLFYYSVPILKVVMPALYFEHYLLLVEAISLLNQSSISAENIDRAEEMLIDFVARFPDLYDKRYMTANLHLLLHLTQTVRELGPLWVTSCFSFENANGHLKKLATGTRFSGLQICTGLSYTKAIPELIENLETTSIVHDFFDRLNNCQEKYKSCPISHKSSAIGLLKRKNEIPDAISELLQALNLIGSNLGVFYRLMKSRIFYSSEMYGRSTRTNSTFVKYYHDDEHHFGIITCFVRISNCECPSYCKSECETRYVAIIKICDVDLAFNNGRHRKISRIYSCDITDNMIYVDVSNLLNVCFYLKVSDEKAYVIEPVNLIEAE